MAGIVGSYDGILHNLVNTGLDIERSLATHAGEKTLQHVRKQLPFSALSLVSSVVGTSFAMLTALKVANGTIHIVWLGGPNNGVEM